MHTVTLEPPRAAKRPQYGQDATAESGTYEEEYYDDEDFDIDEAIAQLEEIEEGMSPGPPWSFRRCQARKVVSKSPS